MTKVKNLTTFIKIILITALPLIYITLIQPYFGNSHVYTSPLFDHKARGLVTKLRGTRWGWVCSNTLNKRRGIILAL